MTKPIIVVVDAATGLNVEREMTDQEFAEHQASIAKEQEAVQQLAQQAAEAAAKRQALLDKLGITEEEAKLLLS